MGSSDPKPPLPSLVVTPADAHGLDAARSIPTSPTTETEPPLSPAAAITSPLVSDLERWAPAPEPEQPLKPQHERTHSRTGSSGAPQMRSRGPLPSMPRPIGPQEDAKNKIASYESDVFKAQNWRRWMGINALNRAASSSTERRSLSSSSTSSQKHHGPVVSPNPAMDIDVGSSAALETVAVVNPDSDSSRSPSISHAYSSASSVPPSSLHTQEPFSKKTATSVPALLKDANRPVDPKDTPSRSNSLQDSDAALQHAKQIASDVHSKPSPLQIVRPTPQTKVVKPQPQVPSALLDSRWSASDTTTPMMDDERRNTLSDWDGQGDESMQILSLAHNNVFTNKDMHAQMRHMRKMPAELRDENTSSRSSKANQASPEDWPHSTPARTPSPFSAAGLPRLSSLLRSSQRLDAQSIYELPASRRGTPDHRPCTPSSSPASASRPHVWRRRKLRAWNKTLAEDDMESDDEDPHHARQGGARVYTTPADPDNPEYVYDMLHENQRGIVLFGVSKRFSSNVLSAFDPSPWTDAQGMNTALTTLTMQLPDPTWEWVHPTWMIDMTGNTDEDGWQYSGSFTGLQFWRRPIQVSSKAGPQQWWQAFHMFAHYVDANRTARRESKEATRPDEGIEALMRSIRSRSARWTGKPGIWTFVRRRRWVRLRRRVAHVHLNKGASVMTADGATVILPDRNDSTSASFIQAHEKEEEALEPVRKEIEEERASSLSETEQVIVALERLRLLLPFFLIPQPQLSELFPSDGPPLHELDAWQHHFRIILEQETCIFNPFFSLGWIQRWLARDDLRHLTRQLRAQEREYQKAHAHYREAGKTAESATFLAPPAGQMYDACPTPPPNHPTDSFLQFAHESSDVRPMIIRKAVVEHNFEMVIILMRLCMVDRLRVSLWLEWLHLSPGPKNMLENDMSDSPLKFVQQEWYRRCASVHQIHQLGSTPAMFSPLVERILRTRIYNFTHSIPILLDVWDILVVHLDDILAMLDHDMSRRHLLQTIQHLASKRFNTCDPEESPNACPQPSDPRWCPVEPNVMALPRIPNLPAP